MDTSELRKCIFCSWWYPAHLLHQFYIGETITDPICGICALRLRNDCIGIQRHSFRGTRAERARRAAERWRTEHPEQRLTLTTRCLHCAMKALVEGRAPEQFNEEPEEHRKRVHSDPVATDRERKLLERRLEQKIRNHTL
jgi:hypothetical protein